MSKLPSSALPCFFTVLLVVSSSQLFVAGQAACTGGGLSNVMLAMSTCQFSEVNRTTTLSVAEVAQTLLVAACQTGSAPNCSTHRYSFSSDPNLHSQKVTAVVQNSSSLVLNVSVSGYANRPGNFSMEVRGFDESCRVFRFCWLIIVPVTASTAASFVAPSLATHSDYSSAFSSLIRVPVRVSSAVYDNLPFRKAISLNSTHVTQVSNYTFKLSWSIQFNEPSFAFEFVSVGYTSPYSYWSSASNLTWSQGSKVFGLVATAPKRNATHQVQDLFWQPLPEWNNRRFFIGLRLHDDVNFYTNNGLRYVAMEVDVSSSAQRSSIVNSVLLINLLCMHLWLS